VPAIEVRICADGCLPPAEVAELKGLGIDRAVEQVVLDGCVVDQAALMGVLERLRRAGLTIRDVAPRETDGVGTHADDADDAADAEVGEVAEVAVLGRVGEIVRSVLPFATVTEGAATTTIEIAVASSDGVFDVLHRLEALALELREVHVAPRGERHSEGLSSLS
jgi:hypothetical protein